MLFATPDEIVQPTSSPAAFYSKTSSICDSERTSSEISVLLTEGPRGCLYFNLSDGSRWNCQ